MKLPRQIAVEALWCSNLTHNYKPVRLIANEHIDDRRWFATMRLVIEYDGKFYAAHYDEPKTEMQDGGRWEGESEVEFKEVFKKEKTVTVYE